MSGKDEAAFWKGNGRSLSREALFEKTQNMIFVFEKDGTVLEYNPAVTSQLGYEAGDVFRIQEVLRTSFSISGGILVFPEEDTPSFQTVIYRKNETCFPVELKVIQLSLETGHFGLCLARDIQKEPEGRVLQSVPDEMEDILKERNELVASITHELRTPVNGILGMIQNLQDTSLSKDQRESVAIIEQCCQNMNKMINNILDYSKIGAGKFKIDNTKFHFYQMIDNIMKLNLPQIEDKGLSLCCNVAEDIPEELIGDEFHLTQVLNNLLSNAIKFTQIGKITVNVMKTLDEEDLLELFFMITDTGIGISESGKDKIFQSFTQADTSIARRFGGTGLGLSIAKELVTMMNGKIHVESKKARGSTFSFSVRLCKPASLKSPSLVNTSGVIQIGSGEIGVSQIHEFGSEENRQEITANMEKLILCIELGNWERANGFAQNVKNLTALDQPLKRKAFQLQMTIRKENYERAVEEFGILKEAMEQSLENVKR